MSGFKSRCAPQTSGLGLSRLSFQLLQLLAITALLTGCPSYPEQPSLGEFQGYDTWGYADTNAEDTAPGDTGGVDVAVDTNEGTLCPDGNLYQSLTLYGPDDLDLLDGCTTVYGDLVITGVIESSLQLSGLIWIEGQLVVQRNPGLVSLQTGSLELVEAVRVIENGVLDNVSLPNLVQTVDLHIANNTALTAFDAPSLRSLTGSLDVSLNDSLTHLPLSALIDVLNLAVRSNPVLASWDLTALRTIGGDLRVEDNPAFPTCEVHVLIEQLSPAYEGQPVIAGNDELTVCE